MISLYCSQKLDQTVSNRATLDQWLYKQLRTLLSAFWLVAIGVFACASVLAQTPAAGITGSPTAIVSGGSSTLTWTTKNAVSADLNGATVALNGSQTVSPTTSTTYRITAHSSTGATDWGQVLITVTSGAPTARLTANPTSIASGGSSTLTWTSTNAVSATLNGASVAVNGSQTVSPTSTTTYTFVATGSSGATATAKATVTVGSTGPTAGISANPVSIVSGGSSTLTWTSTNAVSAKLNGATVAVTGSQTVSPTSTTTYTFVATSASGATATAQATVTVGSSGPPAAGINANPTTIASGASSTLTWTTANAASADLNGATVALNGSQAVSPTASTTYRITAHSSTGATDWGQVTVTVTPGGPTAGISANPTSIASGGSSTLTWTSTNAVSATLNGATVAVNGSQSVAPTATTTYTFKATSSSGATASAQATVTVGSSAPTAGISANPTSIASGGSSTLTWTSTNAVSATLNGATVAVNGSQSVSPTATTTYTFKATSSSGATASAQTTVTVTSGPPSAAISANPTSIAAGNSSTLTWTTNNALSADLNGATVALNGSQVVSPTVTTTYRITAHGANGTTDWGQLTVTVTSSGPVTGQWAPVQTWPFMAAHAHLLSNGSVLFWPSFDNGNNPTLWNPITNKFTTAPMAAYNIFCSGHSMLQDGRLFVAGGHAGNQSDGLISSTAYNPGLNTWTKMSDMNAPRWYPTNTTLPNGDVLVVSGYTTTGVFNTLPQIWHPATNIWLNLTNAQLMQPLYPMMFVAPNGNVFNAGPSQLTRFLNTSGTGAWTTVGNLNYAGTRDYGSAVIFDGKVLVAGGDGSATGPATPTAEIIDLTATTPTWQSTSSMSIARRQFNLTLLPDGKLLASGGSGGFGFDNQNLPVYPAEMWDPATGQWTTMDSITVYRGYHSTALLLPDGRVLSGGGEQTGASAEIYSPPYLFKGARPTITSGPSSVKYGQVFLAATPDAANISQVTWIRLGSVTHSFNQNQLLNHLQFAQATGGLNITAPANANLAPPGHYMLFLVNSNGVPSVARIIQITP